MPFKIKSSDSRCPASKPWSVVNSDTDALHGCHASKDEAEDQLKALYANVPDASNDDSAHSINFGFPSASWPFDNSVLD